MNLELERGESFVDKLAVMPGQIYYYQVKAVSADGVQSEDGPVEGVRTPQT